MSDAINRALASRARQILRIERWLLVFSGLATFALLAAALYFEKVYDVKAYSFAFLAVTLLGSLLVFWALFGVFGADRQAGRRRVRAMLTLASAYVVLVSLAAYAVAFGLFGLPAPWAGPGRDALSICYFLLAAASAFLARSVAFYWRLQAYLARSLGQLIK